MTHSAAFPALAVRVIAKLEADEIGILGGHRVGKAGRGVIIPGFSDREFCAAQGARDQRGRVLQMQGPPEPFSVYACLCHLARSHRWNWIRGNSSSSCVVPRIIQNRRAAVQLPLLTRSCCDSPSQRPPQDKSLSDFNRSAFQKRATQGRSKIIEGCCRAIFESANEHGAGSGKAPPLWERRQNPTRLERAPIARDVCRHHSGRRKQWLPADPQSGPDGASARPQ